MKQRKGDTPARRRLSCSSAWSPSRSRSSLLGQKSALFTRTTTLYVSFADISGLIVGAPVRLAGPGGRHGDGDRVPAELERKETRVRLAVQTKYMSASARTRWRSSTRRACSATRSSTSAWAARAPMLEDGATLQAGCSVSLRGDLDQRRPGGQVAGTHHRAPSTSSIQNEQTTGSCRATSRASPPRSPTSCEQVEHGHGLAHRLIYDPHYASDMRRSWTSVRSVAQKATRAVGTRRRHRGGGRGAATARCTSSSTARTASAPSASSRTRHTSIDDVVREVREGDGVLHALVYEQENSNFLRELNELSRHAQPHRARHRQGAAPSAACVRDPTVYEDLKTILGNVKRNVLFKALIRFTVDKDDMRRMERAPVPVETQSDDSASER